MRGYLLRLKGDFHGLYKLEAAPEAVALGVAFGLMMNFIPSVGFGFVISGIFSSWWGGNIPASVMINVTTSPLIPLFFSINLLAGRFVLGQLQPLGLASATVKTGWLDSAMQVSVVRWVSTFGSEFLLGCAINAILVFVVSRFLVYHLLQRRRAHTGRVPRLSDQG